MKRDSETGATLELEREPYALPEPQSEHDWLMQLAGEWTAEVEIYQEPDQPPLTSSGTESIRPIGGFWILTENRGSFMDKPFTGIMALGYDPAKGRYVGTWIDSMTSHLWVYEGSLDAAQKRLTLRADGPSPDEPGKVNRFRETIELTSPNQYDFTSHMQKNNEAWVHTMTIHYRRRR
jgi:hypothetical protein